MKEGKPFDHESLRVVKRYRRESALQILGLTLDATPEEIKKAHRRLALEFHPDRGGDSQKMKLINAAKAVLDEPER